MFIFKTILSKLIFIGIILLASLAAYFYFEYNFTERLKGEARRINLAGRQRMLTLNITVHILRILGPTSHFDREIHLKRAGELISEYEEALYGLRDGSKRLGLSPMPQEYGESAAQLNTLIEIWQKSQKPTFTDIMKLPPERANQACGLCHSAVRGNLPKVETFVKTLEDHYENELKEFDISRVYALGFFSILAFFIILYVRKNMISPLFKFKYATKEIKKGNFDVRVDIKTKDEIGELGNTFNEMAQTINTMFRVNKENLQELTLLYEISRTACHTLIIEPMLNEVMDLMLRFEPFGIEKTGAIFLCDEKTKTLKLAVERNFTEEHKRMCAVVPFGVCLCGTSAERGEPLLFERGITDNDYTRLYPDMKRYGHLILPIKLKDRTLGIICLYLPEGVKISDRNIGLFKSISETIAVALQNILYHREVILLARSLENSNDAVAITDLEGRLTYVNEEAIRLSGYSQDELMGENFSIFFSSPNNPSDLTDKILKNTMEGGWLGEATGSRKDGSEIPLLVTTSPVKDENGAIIALSGIARDITELKRAEEILRMSHQELEQKVKERTEELETANLELKKLTNAVEQAGESMVITDPHGIIRYVNPAFTSMSGYSSEEAIGKTPHILHSGMTPPGVFKDMWDTILSGRLWIGMVINRKKTGEIYYEETTVTPVHDDEGRIINFIAIKKDVTDRIMAEEAIKRKNIELAEFGFKLHRLYEMSFAKKTNVYEFAKSILVDIAEMLDVDAAAVGAITEGEWTAYAVSDRKGLGIKEGMRIPLNEVYCDIVNKTKRPLIIADATKMEDFRDHPDLVKYGVVSYCGVPLFIGDDLFGVLCTFSKSPHNYSEYDLILHQLLSKRLEFEFVKERYEDDLRSAMYNAEAANRAKSEFLANMSHELRTPLNTIIGFSEIMFEGITGNLTAPQKEYIRDIYESGKHLLSLIDEILDLSKIEAGRMELELSEFNLRKLIDKCLVMFREKAVRHDIKIKTDVEEGIEDIVADERKIKQVILNLLSNAIKFSPDGGAVFVHARRVRSAPSPIPSPHRGEEKGEGGFFIEITVEDTGIGISPEDQKRLFQPFQQLETTLSKKYPGTGLGLNLCKKLIELHGGKIWVESEEGKGSRFTFSIPLRQGQGTGAKLS